MTDVETSSIEFVDGSHLTKDLLSKISLLMRLSEILMTHRPNRLQLELLSQLREAEGMLYYRLIEKISDESRIPESTVRWNLKRLRDAGLILTGSKDNKGIPVELTSQGRTLAFMFEELNAKTKMEVD